jgi:prolyl-tRNA synthetase
MDEKQLSNMTVTNLRELAQKYPSIQGVHAMKKDELVKALFEAMKEKGEISEKIEVEDKEDFLKKKSELKKQIKELKQQRDKALKDKDKKTLKLFRYKIKKLRRVIRKLNLKYKEVKTPE